MKNLKTILFALLSVLTLTACPTDKEEVSFLSVGSNYLPFPSTGGDEEIFVNANVSWAASSDEPWCKIYGGSGTDSGSFGIEVKENTFADSRHATIKVVGGGNTEYVFIEQEGSSTKPTNYDIDSPHDTESDLRAYSRQLQ